MPKTEIIAPSILRQRFLFVTRIYIFLSPSSRARRLNTYFVPFLSAFGVDVCRINAHPGGPRLHDDDVSAGLAAGRGHADAVSRSVRVHADRHAGTVPGCLNEGKVG